MLHGPSYRAYIRRLYNYLASIDSQPNLTNLILILKDTLSLLHVATEQALRVEMNKTHDD